MPPSERKISIIIPCRNEDKFIDKCLTSIINLDYPKDDLEVLVCDGVSSDKTADILNKFANQYSFIRVLINELRTTQYALNMGVKEASGHIKIILGAHAEVYPDFIKECISSFQANNEIGCVGGVIQNSYYNATSRVIGMAMTSRFGVGNARFRTGSKDGYVDTVAFGAYRADIFNAIGYFDAELPRNQDDEFNFRLIRNGYKIYLSNKIRTKYYVRSSFKNLFRQYYQYGYWKVYVNKKHRTITSLRQLAPMIFVLFLLTLIPLISYSRNYLHAALSVTGLYIILGFISAARKSVEPVMILGIAFSFLVLHIGYGLGYLSGVITFLLFNKKPGREDSKLSR